MRASGTVVASGSLVVPNKKIVAGTANYHNTTHLWIKNADGPRTISEARKIAYDNGAEIADDMHFIAIDDLKYDELFGNSYATYGWFEIKSQNQVVNWKAGSASSAGIMDSTGKINIWVRKSVLESDRAITAVFAHEAFEVESLRLIFSKNGGGMVYDDYSRMIEPGSLMKDGSQNLHYQAVDYGDELVRDMVKAGL